MVLSILLPVHRLKEEKKKNSGKITRLKVAYKEHVSSILSLKVSYRSR